MIETKFGVVIRSTGSQYTVIDNQKKEYSCKLKGSFKIEGIKSTNPIAVGDNVEFIESKGDDFKLITKILPRKNYIIRKSTKLSKQTHIIASNVEQLIIMATIAKPRTSTGFIDRLLVTSEAYHVPAIIIFNKIDMYLNKEINILNELTDIYSSIGYKTIATSAIKHIGIEDVIEILKNKTSVLSGHSGVGKSALINACEPNLNLKTCPISLNSKKGKHTTTFAEMFKLNFGGYIIDTPGIKEFGLVDFDKCEIGERFPEFRKLMSKCQFNNCTHTHEPDCEVKKAVKNGSIATSRYQNYLNILNDYNLF